MSIKQTMAGWRRYVNENQRRAADEHLWEQHVEGRQFSEYARRYANQILAEKLFSLDEKKIDIKKSGLVKDLIAAGKWEKPTAKEFKEVLSKSEMPEMLTNYSIGELSKMDLFKLTGHDIGFALKQFSNPYTNTPEGGTSEIVAVHNNEPMVGGVGKVLMKAAIDSGGCYLDHFDGFLTDLYGSIGFKEYLRFDFDADYAPAGFEEKHGPRDVIFRHLPPCQPPVKPDEEQKD